MDADSIQKRQVGTMTVRELMQGFGSFRGSEPYKFKKDSAAGGSSDEQ